jgi:TPP-dependent pyruvate/acetoin dehydrogenase alpha subunit
MRSHLASKKLWNEADQSALVSEYENSIAESIARQEKSEPLPETTLFFDDVYAKKPWFLEEEERKSL